MKDLRDNFDIVDDYEVYYGDIADNLLKLSGLQDDEEVSSELNDAMFDLYATCQNEYNRDCFRVFYNVLAIISNKIDNGEFDYE